MHYYDDTTPIEETLGVLADCVHAGKVRSIGCSNYFAWQLAEANVVARSIGAIPFASCQMMYNLVRRDLERDIFPRWLDGRFRVFRSEEGFIDIGTPVSFASAGEYMRAKGATSA